YVPARTGPGLSRRARAVSIERAKTAQKTRNIHPYPRNRRRAVFNWNWDAAKPSDPGSIAPAAKANTSAIAIGPATLGAAAVRATSTRARSTRRAFRSSFRVRAAVRAAVARAIATTTAPTREAAYAWDETAAENHGAVVPFAVHTAKTAMATKTAVKAE